jgi:hypothetical protein
MSFFGNLLSKAVPFITKAFSVGKSIVPQVLGAVGKVSNAIQTGKAVGKQVKQVLQGVAPELVDKVEQSKAFQVASNILNKTEQGLGMATNYGTQAQNLLNTYEGKVENLLGI